MVERTTGTGKESTTSPLVLIVAWAAVGLPLLWGVGQTIRKALALFH